MDAASLASKPYQASPGVVPPEIYKALLEVAKQGYEADDVTRWYSIVKRDLDQLHAANADTAYSLTPPFSVCSPAPPERETHTVNSPLGVDVGPQIYATPTTNSNFWSEPFLSDPFQANQINATTSGFATPSQTCTTTAADQSTLLQLSSPWSATTSTFPNIQSSMYPPVVHAPNLRSPVVYHPAQLDTADSYTTFDAGSRKRRASQPPPSYNPMGITPISYGPPLQQTMPLSSSPFPPTPTSNEITYLAPISIIPSRKRRKTLPKGMKKVIQPFQLQRQS